MDTIQKAYGFAICLLYDIYYSSHMAKPDACHVAGMWLLYGCTIWLPSGYHRGGIWICTWKSHYIAYIYLQCGINMAAIWFSHI